MPHRENHGIDDTTNHTGVSGATEDNIITFNANGLPKDSGVGITALGGTMQDAYDTDASILFSKNMVWDLNQAYTFELQEGTQSVEFTGTAANQMTAALNVESVDIDANSNVTINNSVAGNAWTEVNGTYYCPGGGNALEQLLLYLRATTNLGGVIILGEGLHDITWTTYTAIDEQIHIIGSGQEVCWIRFTAADADCRFVFSERCIIEGVRIQASSSAANLITFTGDGASYSVIRNCYFSNLLNLSNSAISFTSGAHGVRIENCRFTDMNTANSYLFYINACDRIIISGCYSGSVRNTYLLYTTGTVSGLEFVDNYFVAGSTRPCCLIRLSYLYANSVNISGNYFDHSSNVITSAVDLIELGYNVSSGASYGQHRFVNNYVKCVKNTTSWYAGANILSVNVGNCVVTNNVFETQGIGYTNTQIGRIIYVDRYGINADISNNTFRSTQCRHGIYLYASAGVILGCRIIGNNFTSLDHDGTGVGACIELGVGSISYCVQGAVIMGNYLGGSSNIYSIYAANGTVTVEPRNCSIIGNIVAESALPIANNNINYSTFIGNVSEASAGVSGASIGSTNTNNVYGDDGAGTPSTVAPGANQ